MTVVDGTRTRPWLDSDAWVSFCRVLMCVLSLRLLFPEVFWRKWATSHSQNGASVRINAVKGPICAGFY